MLFQEASSTLEVRKGEIANESTHDEMRIRAEQIDSGITAFGESDDADGQAPESLELDCFQLRKDNYWLFMGAAFEWLKEFCELTKRKKKNNPFTTPQIQDMLKFRKLVVSSLETELHKRTSDKVFTNLTLACRALKEDGYLEKHGLTGALSLPELFEELQMRDVMDHKIWQEAPSKQIEAHNVNCKILVDVISHILGATKAQKALGYVPAGSPAEVENPDNVEI